MSEKNDKVPLSLNKNTVCIIAVLLCLLSLIFMFFNEKDEYTIAKTKQNLWMALINNDPISMEIKNTGIHNSSVTAYLTNNIKAGEVIIEVGANLGYYTLLMAKLVSSNGHIYSFEAMDNIYNLADLSIRMNNLTDIVTLKNVCVSDKNGKIDFLYDKPHTDLLDQAQLGTFGIRPTRNNAKESAFVKKLNAVPLDDELHNLKNVDWMIMNIDGAELLALHGAKKIIESSPNIKIVTEWNPTMLNNYGNVAMLIDWLHDYGFKFYKIDATGFLSKELTRMDLLKTSKINILLIRD